VCYQVECVGAVSHRVERRSRPGDVGVLPNGASERAEHCVKARQVIVARRQDCGEQSTSALGWGELGRHIGS
jgi:hypothetical protein